MSVSHARRGRSIAAGFAHPADSAFVASAAAEPQSALVRSAKDVFAGTCGGITVTLVGHPFDTVKVLLQTQSATNPAYKGPLDAASKVVRVGPPNSLPIRPAARAETRRHIRLTSLSPPSVILFYCSHPRRGSGRLPARPDPNRTHADDRY